MYIKLTKLDNAPIWLNAAFIVTIERGRNGGAVVVPVGDGLDYDVRESPEAVLAMLDGAPVAAVVPVPTKDALVPAPPDVSPEPLSGEEKRDEQRAADKAKAAEAKADSPDGGDAQAAAESAAGERRDAAMALNTAVIKKAEAKAAAALAKQAAAAKAEEEAKALEKLKWRGGRKPKLPLDEEQVARLRKMMPKTVNKLRNTLSSQFKAEDVDKTIRALGAHGVIELDGSRVTWSAPAEK